MAVILAMIPASGAVAGVPEPSSSDQSLRFFDDTRGLWSVSGNSYYFGVPKDIPLTCDWDGDGYRTVGVYRTGTGQVFFRNQNDFGVATGSIFFGVPGDRPICGDWDGDGTDSIGIIRPSEGKFYLRNSNTQGIADIEFYFGGVRLLPLAGDWNGDGVDEVGVHDPVTGYTALAPGHGSTPMLEAFLGTGGDHVFVDDWNGDGVDDVVRYSREYQTLAVTDHTESALSSEVFALPESPGLPIALEEEVPPELEFNPSTTTTTVRPSTTTTLESTTTTTIPPTTTSTTTTTVAPTTTTTLPPTTTTTVVPSTTTTVAPSTTSTTVPPVSSGSVVYGAAVGGSGLNNSPLKGDELYSNPFRAVETGQITKFRRFIRWDPNGAGTGYDSGDGGSLRFEIQTDDGTGRPSGTVLGWANVANAIPNRSDTKTEFTLQTLGQPAAVTKGVLYHLVVSNASADPVNNWVSMNDLATLSGSVSPATRDPEWTVMYWSSTNGWTTRDRHSAILELHYGNGTVFGNGYMNIFSRTPEKISGSNQVREAFTVSGGDRTIRNLTFRTIRVGDGQGALTATLTHQNGSVLAQTTLPATSVPQVSSGLADSEIGKRTAWVTFPSFSPVTLKAGTTYYLTFTAPTGTQYSATAIREGTKLYGFSTQTVFSDGNAQYTTGNGWTNWKTWGNPATDTDLSFYLTN